VPPHRRSAGAGCSGPDRDRRRQRPLIAGRRPAATVMGIAVILAGVVAALALLGPAPANLMGVPA